MKTIRTRQLSINEIRLLNWVETLSKKELKSILIITADELIDLDILRFWNNSDAPYWHKTGNTLDTRGRYKN